MTPEPSLLFAFLFLSAGLLLLVGGGEVLVSGAVHLARGLGLSTLIIGLTVVAFGTSTPELFVSLAAMLGNHPEIMIGNVVGSNIANIGLILGIAALMAPLPVLSLNRVQIELALVLAAGFVLILFAWTGDIPRAVGFIFIAALILYTWHAYRREITTQKKNESAVKRNSRDLALSSAKIVAGLILLAYGSHLFIRGAVDVARYFEVSELIIGLTLAAVGTSLPELASTVAAVRHQQNRLIIGNIIGSNLFNLLMVLGCAAAVRPFSVGPEILYRDLPVMTLFTLLLLPLLAGRRGIGRLAGLFLLCGYMIYIILLY